jgi:hypothetical protein
MEIVEQFVTVALQKLQKKPSNMQEMQDAKAAYFELRGKKKEMSMTMSEMLKKNNLLQTVSGQSLSTSNIQKNWEVCLLYLKAEL